MDYALLAAQLRKPEGDFGKKVAANMNNSNSVINLRTIELLGVEESDKVLEIGMGNGFFCANVLAGNESVTYTGCDFSELMVEEAEVLNKELVRAGRATFVPGDLIALPFEDNSFSKLFTVNTIYFWQDIIAALGEICRVLQPGGVAVISLRTKESMSAMPFVQYGFRLLEENDLRALLGYAGFDSVKIDCEPDPPFYMEGVLIQLESLYAVCRLGGVSV